MRTTAAAPAAAAAAPPPSRGPPLVKGTSSPTPPLPRARDTPRVRACPAPAGTSDTECARLSGDAPAAPLRRSASATRLSFMARTRRPVGQRAPGRERDMRTGSDAEDGAREDTEPLRNASVYLDSQCSRSAFDVDDLHVPPAEIERTRQPPPPEEGRRRRNRAARAERLAAEQAAWLRNKFKLEQSEELVASFSAALVKHILLQGHIHITTNALCFYAKIFGRVTKEMYRFTDISRVKKRKSGFIANAIKIYFADPEFNPVIIGSLNHRERAFNIIQSRLRDVNPSAADSLDVDNIVPDPPHDSDDQERTAILERANSIASVNSRSSGRLSNSTRPPQYGESETASHSSRKSSESDLVPLSPGPEPPRVVWRTDKDMVDMVAANAYHRKTERTRGVLDAPVRDVFNELFISDWIRNYHNVVNNRDLTLSEWMRAPDGYMTRELTFRRPLGYRIGPKETRVKETQRYSFLRGGGVIVELEGRNLDAPYGDYFVIESFFEMFPHNNDTQCLFVASIAVHFNKNTMLRGKIESGALTETKVAFQHVLDLAVKKIDEVNATSKDISRKVQNLKRASSKGSSSATQPGSPTKKLRSSDGLTLPLPTVIGTAQNSTGLDAFRGSDRLAADDGLLAQRSVTGSMHSDLLKTDFSTDAIAAAIEVRDFAASKSLRTIAITALVMVCLLLIGVIILLYTMRNEVSALEKLVTQMHVKRAESCAGQVCALAVEAGSDV